MANSRIYEIVRDAVERKRVVTAIYHGCYREMCPNIIGWSNGHERALFYQFGGGSSSGLGPDGSYQNWRCINLAELSDVKVRDGQWRIAANHSRKQTCVKTVDLETC
jgi:hypothetical protein